MTSNLRFADRIDQLTGSVAREILSRTQNSNIISLAGGLPDPEIWNGLSVPEADVSSYQYGASEGDRPLRELFARRFLELGVSARWDQSIILSGSQQGLDLVSKLFLMKGRTVIVEDPCYLAALQVFRLFEATIVGVPMDENGIDVAALEAAIEDSDPAFVYLNPSFQNPTGICYSAARRDDVAALLQRTGTVLVEDDPYRDLNYGAGPASLPIVSRMSGNWLYLNSVSKLLMPGLRLGVLACSERLFPPLLMLKQAVDLHTNRIAQSIVGKMLSSRENMDSFLSRVIDYYASKRDFMEESLHKNLDQLAEWNVPQGGMFFWLRFKVPLDMKKLLERCLERGVSLMPGDPFFVDGVGKGRYIRLNFTRPSTTDIEKGIQAIAEIASQLSIEVSKKLVQ